MKPQTYIFCLLSFALCGCVKDYLPENDNATGTLTRAGMKEGQVFYYYGYEDRKIPLDLVSDKVFVKFAPTATMEQFLSVAADNESLRAMDGNAGGHFVEGYHFNTLVLRGGEIIPQEIVHSFKGREEIVSATYLLESGDSQYAYTDEFIVKLKDGTSYTQMRELAEKYDCTIGEKDEFVRNQYMLHVSKASEFDAMQTSNLFYETGLFEFAEPNLLLLNADKSNDPFFSDQWGLKNMISGQADINVEPAWAITKGHSNIRIAVVESGGVELNHPDLQGNMLPGYDASGHGTGGGTYDSHDNHGTAVAGIIAALQNNTDQGSYIGISGVAPNSKIVPIKAGGNGFVNTNWAATSINWVVNNSKAEVINCSWGGNGIALTNLTEAINRAVTKGRGNKGCIVVCASGNDGSYGISYPANLSNTIAVGAVDRYGYRASFSNYGADLNVVAPGLDIYTTDRQGDAGYNSDTSLFNLSNRDYTMNFVGTSASAAAPHVAGVAALILSKNPDLPRKGVTDIIESTAKKVGGYGYATAYYHDNGTWNNQMGYGLVDAHAAVSFADCVESAIDYKIVNNTPYTIWSVPVVLTGKVGNISKTFFNRVPGSIAPWSSLSGYPNHPGNTFFAEYGTAISDLKLQFYASMDVGGYPYPPMRVRVANDEHVNNSDVYDGSGISLTVPGTTVKTGRRVFTIYVES